MFSLRTNRPSAFLRSIVSSTSATTSPQTAVAGRRFASDYGSGDKNIDTPNPAVDQEHPGPPPPSTARQGNESQQQQQSEGASKHQSANNTSSSSKSVPQPKILSESPPAEGNEPADVARHNKEMDQRADKPHEKVKNKDAKDDKVPKGFWQGQGGRDGDP